MIEHYTVPSRKRDCISPRTGYLQLRFSIIYLALEWPLPMHRNSKKHIAAAAILIQHWGKFGTLDSYHKQWALQHSDLCVYRRNDWVYAEGWSDKIIFYVCSGILARVRYDEQDDRHILSVGLPGMAMLSTEHLYSETQAEGSIVALRNSTLLALPYHAVKALKEEEKSLNNFISALHHKKLRQLARLRAVGRIVQPTQRYIHFAKRLPDLHYNLTQTEQAELLGISRSTISRTLRIL